MICRDVRDTNISGKKKKREKGKEIKYKRELR